MPMATPNQQDYYRFCPGEERIKLSNAVCLGRRRANYPKCKGCQFNDDENKIGGLVMPGIDRKAAEEEKNKRERIASIFKAYDIRGVYPQPLDEELAWRIGQATANFLRSELRGYERSRTEKSAVVVGRDMRKSSPALAAAVIEGLRSGGSPVIDIGMVDTPQLYFAVNHITCCGGVQVTASHNPGTYNGFKICGEKGKPVSADTGLNKISKAAINTIRHTTPQMAGLEQRDLSGPYKQFVRQFLTTSPGGYNSDRPMKVVVDASNGMAGRWFPVLFGDVEWLEVTRLNFEHNGDFRHEPNPLVPANLSQLCDRMKRTRAAFGVCFDGDADRTIFVDCEGRIIPADLMTALLAGYFLKKSPGSAVVYDLRSSRVVPEEIRKAGGLPRRERAGHAMIKKTMMDAKAVFGGELSGHYYYRDNGFCDSGMITFAQVVNLLIESGQPLHELIEPLRRYAHSGERSFHNEDKTGTIQRLADRYSDGEIDYLDGITVQYADWWFNVRPSNTEPFLRLNVEARDEEMLKGKLNELFPLMGTPA
ncbi:MAG: phosphomannomutase/phosphoglucomutase [Phycisphaerae bacterium]|nr:phosphomannomutase/phosphoglucomutase [Phycisphaerae bacterium]